MNKSLSMVVVLLLGVMACNGNKPDTSATENENADTAKVCLMPSDRNPNGASELALLMRTMEAQADVWKNEIESGAENLSPVPDVYNTLKTAIPTEKEMKNEHYDAFADDFINYSKALVKAPKAERKTAFNAMVGGCLACHSQMCPGPVKRINKFYF